jgi:hypothetical protein
MTVAETAVAHRDPVPSETAVARRNSVAPETGRAVKAVNSVAQATDMAYASQSTDMAYSTQTTDMTYATQATDMAYATQTTNMAYAQPTDVTSAAKTTPAASADTTATPRERDCASRRCRYAEHDGRNCCNHLFTHFSKLLMFHLIWTASVRALCSYCWDWFTIAPIWKDRQNQEVVQGTGRARPSMPSWSP